VIFGDIGNHHVAELKDIDLREALVLGAFAAGVLVVGVWPAPLTHLMDASVKQIVDQLLTSKI
jgi:NADH-quinone oxidoreductase subunit M